MNKQGAKMDLHEAALRFDIKRLDASFLDDPFPVYRALREHDPVHRMPDGSYFLSRYDDCAAVYRDPEVWSSDKKVDFKPNLGDSSLFEHHTTAWFSTIRRITQGSASCWHRLLRRGRSRRCSPASRPSSIANAHGRDTVSSWNSRTRTGTSSRIR
jgi:hypothetical protein